MPTQEQAFESIPIQLGGKTWRMRATLKTCKKMKRWADENAGIEIEDYIAQLACMLLQHEEEGGDPEITADRLEEMIDLSNLRVVKDAINAALGRDAFAAGQEDEDETEGDEAGGEGAVPFGTSTSEPSGPRAEATV